MRNAIRLIVMLFVAVAAQAALLNNSTQSVSFQESIPCANGGQGEVVDVHGKIQTLLTWTVVNNTVSGIYRTGFPSMTGTGESTGLTYRFTGYVQETFHIPLFSFPYGTYKGQQNFFLVSEGGEPDLKFHQTVNFFTPDGGLTITHDNFFITCQ